jgi:Transposase.
VDTHHLLPVREFKAMLSVRKIMAIVFCHHKGVVQGDVLDHGDNGITKCYCGTLTRLRHAIHHKKPGLLYPDILHDNAMPHSANWTCEWVWCYGW